MKGLYEVICKACGWFGKTDHPPPAGPRDFCPVCLSKDIEIKKP